MLDKYFSDTTMSVHIKTWTRLMSKVGSPWNRQSVYTEGIMLEQEVQSIIDILLQEVINRSDSFLEIDRKLSKVLQIGHYRVVIVLPPLSDGLELTIVKPIKRLSIADYHLDPKIIDLLQHKSQWILVSGAPGSGKTTFAQALIDVYAQMNKVIKTVESPRDLMVPEEVVQYSFTHWTHDEVRDILLLSRPDFTIYDEVRNTSDFLLYKDLRLTGIGLVGIIHATNPIDSIQRFVGNIELGVIPQVIDTVIFIQWWEVQEIYTLHLTVKTPSGMVSADLARPIIEVKSYLTGELLYELYSFGEQIVVIPIADLAKNVQAPADKLAEQYVREFLDKQMPCEYVVHVNNNDAAIYVSEDNKWSIIGKWWENVMYLEKQLWGLHISIKTFDELPEEYQWKKSSSNEQIEFRKASPFHKHSSSNYSNRKSKRKR